MELSANRQTGNGAVHLLGAVQLPRNLDQGGRLWGISDLAWDADERILYAVTDGGMLVHIRPVFQNNRLLGARLLGDYRLEGRDGSPLYGFDRDAEGMDIVGGDNGVGGDSELLISFEGNPRISRYTSQGRYLGPLELPLVLRDRHTYENPNRGLESVTLHPVLGVLTAPEYPLRNEPSDRLSIFSLAGQHWDFPRAAAFNSALVAMDTAPDGSVVILERAWFSPVHPLVIGLRRLHLPADPKSAAVAVEDLAVFDSNEGWRMDNFEGLAHHRGSRWFMVSDDNQRATQRSLLVYFEIENGSE
ncbi:MAG: esterase-like activity of phytase family protein [Chromatiales bacterium]|nr:esterase-like activity of phytase family protein [Chromatiales bacterium]